MKKIIIVISTMILAINLIVFIYNQIISESFRYETPEEAFIGSSKQNSELIDILKDQDIALLIYKDNTGAFSHHIIAKDSRGWTSMNTDYYNKRQISHGNGFIYLKEVNRKNVIQIVLVLEANEKSPIITDDLKSVFTSKSYALDSGKKIFYGLSVLDTDPPDSYAIIIDDQQISINKKR